MRTRPHSHFNVADHKIEVKKGLDYSKVSQSHLAIPEVADQAVQVAGLPPRDEHPRLRLVREVRRADDAALPEGRPRAAPAARALARASSDRAQAMPRGLIGRRRRRGGERGGGRFRAVQGRA